VTGGVVRDTYELPGCRIDVDAPAGRACDAVRVVLRGFGPVDPAGTDVRPCVEVAPVPTGGWRVTADGTPPVTTADLVDAVSALEWTVIRVALERSGDVFHLHGAALCAPAGDRSLAIVGASGSGKTTLALGLLAAGWLPYADDAVLLDPETLGLQPFRRWFHVSEETWRLIGRSRPARDAEPPIPAHYFFPTAWAERSCPLRWLLVLDRRTPGPPAFVRLTPAEAATALLGQTLTLERAPRLALATAARVADQVECYRFSAGEVGESLAAVRDLVARTTLPA
jgi:hypothetical protein